MGACVLGLCEDVAKNGVSEKLECKQDYAVNRNATFTAMGSSKLFMYAWLAKYPLHQLFNQRLDSSNIRYHTQMQTATGIQDGSAISTLSIVCLSSAKQV